MEKNTTKNVYKAEEVEKGKIENSKRPIKSGPLLPLQTCGTSCPLPRGKRHQRLHALAPASRTWAGNAAMIRWSEIWENRIIKGGGDQYDHIYMETKQWNQRGLAPLMLMPRGVVVWRRLIHFDSRARRWYWLVLPGLSTAIMVISFLECPGRLKCLATGFSLLFFASPQCSRRRCLRVLLVSPTYCWLHLLQVMTYMILVDKQLSEWRMVKFSFPQ